MPSLWPPSGVFSWNTVHPETISQSNKHRSDVLSSTNSRFGNDDRDVVLPVHVISIGGSQADAGLVNGAASITALLFRAFVGWLTDVWRRRPTVIPVTQNWSLGGRWAAINRSLKSICAQTISLTYKTPPLYITNHIQPSFLSNKEETRES
jgi:hypothetical protein